MHGFYRIAAAVNQTTVTNPKENSKRVLELIKLAYANNVSVVVFPELTLVSYTASDLFFQHRLLQEQNNMLSLLLKETKEIATVAIIGLAIVHKNRLYNCAAVLQNGKIHGFVPKTYLPNKKEFYEQRQFVSGRNIVNELIEFEENKIPFGINLLFGRDEMLFGIEICEDLWAITPPSDQLASNGANVIFNLSASNELIGKAEYRESLVRGQSATAICAYAYASSGVGESTTDTLFGGDALICEYGSLLARSERFSLQDQLITADIDIQKLMWLRLSETSFAESATTDSCRIQLQPIPQIQKLTRYIHHHPFVPNNPQEQKHRCDEIVHIQAHGLIKRMNQAHIKKAILGISGGLDSTLALLSTHRAFEIMGWDYRDIVAVTMPGFGTTSRTKSNATELCNTLGVTFKELDITEISLKEFEAIGHDRKEHSVTYENVQARARTSILMNMANKIGAIVIGTGDLSEIALGWSTYNGDHMSMYALNSGIPKTLIRYVIEHFATDTQLSHILYDILNTPISPELLPHNEDSITQVTESIVGPYELHDFFLYHIIKYGATPSKVLFLAEHAFAKNYTPDDIKAWLRVFIKRFFTQQFKRSCMPDGPKVGTISLSPRADWKMPSDADMSIWLEQLQ